MSRLRLSPKILPQISPGRVLQRLGSTGTFGLLLLAGSLALVFFVLLPASRNAERLALQLQQRESRLAAERQDRVKQAQRSPESQLAEFYQAFPGREQLLVCLGKIHELADQQTLKLDQAQYKFAAESGSRLAHYQIALPVSGSYPQLRRFIELALAELPALELHDLVFKRDGIDKENVDAQLQFVLYVRSG